MAKYLVFILLFVHLVSCTIHRTERPFIWKCPKFVDTRSLPIDKNVLVIPGTLSSQAVYTSFNLSEIQLSFKNFSIKDISTKNIKCSMANTLVRNISWKSTTSETGLSKPRNFHFVSSGSSKRPSRFYLTETGKFYDATSGNYYKTDGEYCVQS